MLTILADPAAITGRRCVPWGAGTIFEQIAREMPDGGGDCKVLFNGIEIDPLTDARMDAPPQVGDEVVIVHRPEGVEVWVLAISLALAAYSYTLIPKPTDAPTSSDSPNNSLSGQSNIARAYQAVPDVYGMRRVWPDLIQPSLIGYDSDGVKIVTEWLCVSRGRGTVDRVSYADTLIRDIPGSSSQFFEPASGPNTYPEQNDTTLVDVLEPRKSPEVNGQELTSESFPSGISRASTISFSTGRDFTLECDDGADLDGLKSLAPSGSARVEFTLLVNAGSEDQHYEWFGDTCDVLGYTVAGSRVTFSFHARNYDFFAASTSDTTATIYAGVAATTIGPFVLPMDGDTIRANVAFLRGLKGTVNIDAEFWQIDAAGAEIGGTRQTVSSATAGPAGGPLFIADTYDQRFFTWDIEPSAGLGRYVVQFSRTTADLGNGADVAKLDELYAIRTYATKTLPGVTVVRLDTRATLQATGIRERKFNLWWTRKVRTLTSSTISASRNFARSLVHAWVIAGNDVSEIDTTALAAVNASFGEDSPLLRFDWSFDDANVSLGERMQTIANAARCVLWRDGTKWTVTREQRRDTPSLQLDYRNLAASGDSSISYAAHLPASNDGVEVEFVKEVSQATKDYVRLDIGSGSVVTGTSANPKKIKLVGCASSQQALNRAHLEARKLLYQRTSVTDTALADVSSYGPGSTVRWVDPCDFYGDDGLQAGEVLTIDGSTITTSEALQWGAETTGRMIFTGVDGQALGSPIVVTPNGDGAVLASVPGGLYVRDDTRQLGSRYSFGPGLTQAEIEAAGLYTLTALRPTGDREVEVQLVNYDARCFAMDYSQPVGVAQETDTAFALRSPAMPVGIGFESDSARALGVARPVARADETDSALALAARQSKAVGIATEADEALAL